MRAHIMAGLTCDDLLLSSLAAGFLLLFWPHLQSYGVFWLVSFCAIPFDSLYLFDCTLHKSHALLPEANTLSMNYVE
jgi:hypothetical protein